MLYVAQADMPDFSHLVNQLLVQFVTMRRSLVEKPQQGKFGGKPAGVAVGDWAIGRLVSICGMEYLSRLVSTFISLAFAPAFELKR